MAPRLRGSKGTTPATTGRTVTDPSNPPDTEDTGDTVSITRAEFKNFNSLQGDCTQLLNDYGDSKREVVKLQEELTNSQDNNEELTKRIQERDALIVTLNEKIEEFGEALRDAGKNPALVKNKELWEQACVATEKYLSRTWKFLQDEADAVKATKEVIAFLPSPLTIDEDEFVKVYQQAINEALQSLRHKIQSECKQRVKGTETFEAFTRKNLTF